MKNETRQLLEDLARFENHTLYDRANQGQERLLRDGYIERLCMPTALAWGPEERTGRDEHREEFLMRTSKPAPRPAPDDVSA